MLEAISAIKGFVGLKSHHYDKCMEINSKGVKAIIIECYKVCIEANSMLYFFCSFFHLYHK